MSPFSPVAEPWLSNLGWALLHFVWQGTLLALALYLVLFITRRAQVRYRLACLTLALLVAAPVGTLVYLTRTQSVTSSAPASSTQVTESKPVANAPGNGGLEVMATGPTAADSTPTRLLRRGQASIPRQFLPYLVAAWLLGVAGLSLRLFGGWWLTRRWQRARVAPREVQRSLQVLSRRLGVGRPVRLLVSAGVRAPVVWGTFKPVVLLPASALTGLSCEQLELVLAHELAHVARHDYLVNLLQNLAETLLFYHPAVWWVSGMVRQEREFCCDDAVTGLGGDRLVYAAALTQLERGRATSLALSATDGPLLRRVKRLLGVETSAAPVAGWPLLLTAAATVFLTVTLSLQAPALAQADVTPPPNVQGQSQVDDTSQLWVDVEGEVTLTEDHTAVASISKGGFLELYERLGNRTVKFVHITPETNGLSYFYAENTASTAPEGSTLTLRQGDKSYTLYADLLYFGTLPELFNRRYPEGAAWLREALQGSLGPFTEENVIKTNEAWGRFTPEGESGPGAQSFSLVNAAVESGLLPVSVEFQGEQPDNFASLVDGYLLHAVHLKAHRYVSDASVNRLVRDLFAEHSDVLTPDVLRYLLYLVAEVEGDAVKADLLKEVVPYLATDLQLQTAFRDAVMTLEDKTLQREVLDLLKTEEDRGDLNPRARDDRASSRARLSALREEAALEQQSQGLVKRVRVLQSLLKSQENETSHRQELEHLLEELNAVQERLEAVRASAR